MKALVTGGTGFIGKRLAELLRERGHDVLAVGHRDLDITDAKAVSGFFFDKKPDAVFHLAASNVMSGVLTSPEDLEKVNIGGTENVLDAAKKAGVGSFITTGSFLEYNAIDRQVRETDTCDPKDPYSKSKLAATQLCLAAAQGGLPAVVFRIFTPYGPGIQKGRLVRAVIEKALSNEPIRLTEKNIARDFIYVDDICELLIEGAAHARENAGEIFNLGSGERTTLEDLIAHILEKTGSTSTPQWGALPRVSYDADTWQADMTKTRAAFVWRPKIGLSEGLDRTIASLR